MPAVGPLKYLYLAYFSDPSAERPLYRAIRRRQVRTIVELGVGMGIRSARLIEVAQRYHAPREVCYTGIDLFEARPCVAPGMTLKRAHRTLGTLGAKIQLVPGDPLTALSRTANSLTGTDLLIVSADQDAESLARAWFYVPRMLHEGSQVFVEEMNTQDGKPMFRPWDRSSIDTLISSSHAARRAA